MSTALDHPLANSLREAVMLLRRPFLADLVLWRPIRPDTGEFGQVAEVAPYVNRALVIDRLNVVCGHLWHENFQTSPPSHAGGPWTAWCSLTIDGVTRHDQGASPTAKGMVSDSLKRVAAQFGVATYLTAAPRIEFPVGDTDRARLKRVDGDVFLTEAGRAKCASLHRDWLDRVGTAAYGAPLEHGAPDQRRVPVLQGESHADRADREAADARAERDAVLFHESLIKRVQDVSDQLGVDWPPVDGESVEDLQQIVTSLERALELKRAKDAAPEADAA